MKSKLSIASVLLGTMIAANAQASPGGLTDSETADAPDAVTTPELPTATEDTESPGATDETVTDAPAAAEEESGPADSAIDGPGAYWDLSAGEPVAIDAVDPRVRTTLESAAGQGKVSNISRVNIDGREVFRALAREPLVTGSHRDKYLFVDADGDLIKTQEPMEIAEAPESVRVVAERLQQGSTGSALMRETTDGAIHYLMRVSRDDRRNQWFKLDQAGNVLESTDSGTAR